MRRTYYENAIFRIFPTTSSEVAMYDDSESDRQVKVGPCTAKIITASTNNIGIRMSLLVRILQYLGGYPIKIETSEKINKNKSDSKITHASHGQSNQVETVYKTTIFKWTEVDAWYSYIALALKTISLVIYLFNIGLGIAYPVKLYSFGPELQKMFSKNNETEKSYAGIAGAGTIAVALNIVKTILIFWNTPGFVRWLNSWSIFERDFEKCFKVDDKNKLNIPFTMADDIHQFSKWVLFLYFAFPTTLWMMFEVIYMLPMYIYHVEFVSKACMIVGVVATFVFPLMEDAKVLIMLKTQVLAFEQILAGVKEFGQTQTLIYPAIDVISWRNLVKQARDQTALASQYFKSQEMISIAETIISCSVVVSYTLRSLIQDGINTESIIFTVGGNMYYCLNYLTRLYFKVLLGEKISSAELLLADKILQIDSTTGEAATKTELKFLYSQIVQNTITVNFGNYFALDKKFLLTVCAQVVTYLIVIMQFQSSK